MFSILSLRVSIAASSVERSSPTPISNCKTLLHELRYLVFAHMLGIDEAWEMNTMQITFFATFANVFSASFSVFKLKKIFVRL